MDVGQIARSLLLWLVAVSGAVAQPIADPAEIGTLSVATRAVPPFAIRTAAGWEGISVELWSRVAEQLGRPFKLRELGLHEMLAAVEAGTVDAAAAALTITSDREARVDFSHPFHTSGLGIAVHRTPGGEWLEALQRVFSGQFLKAMSPLLLLLTLSAVLVWLVERRRNPQFDSRPVRGIGAGLWWSAVTMTTVGYGDKAPVTAAGRLIAMIWMFAGVVIVSSLTAAIATALTVGKLEQSVSGLEDLYRSRVLTLVGSTSEDFLQERLVRFRTAESLPAALQALADGQAEAVVYDIPILRYLVAEGYPDSLRVLPQILQRQDYGIALPVGSPLREDVNRALLQIIGSPEWQRLLERYLGRES